MINQYKYQYIQYIQMIKLIEIDKMINKVKLIKIVMMIRHINISKVNLILPRLTIVNQYQPMSIKITHDQQKSINIKQGQPRSTKRTIIKQITQNRPK